MKSKVISVSILSIALILVSLIFVSSFGLSKPNPKPNPERITFSGDLYGDQEVEGCCGNAGPFPEYTMTLSDNFPEEFQGTHIGNIFLNSFGRKMPWAYKVQFWWGGENNEYFIEIRGGEVHKDKRTKILTVTFTQEDTCWTWDPSGDEIIIFIEFTLIKDPQRR